MCRNLEVIAGAVGKTRHRCCQCRRRAIDERRPIHTIGTVLHDVIVDRATVPGCRDPGQRHLSVAGNRLYSRGCRRQRVRRDCRGRSGPLTYAHHVDGPHAEDIRRGIGEARYRLRRGSRCGVHEGSPVGAAVAAVFHLVVGHCRAVGRRRGPGERGLAIARRCHDAARQARHIGQGDGKRRAAVELSGQQRVVGEVRQQAGRAGHRRLRRGGDHVGPAREHRRCHKDNLIGVFVVLEHVVGSVLQHDTIAGDRERGRHDRGLIDTHTHVAELQHNARHAAGIFLLQTHGIGTGILVLRPAIERLEKRQRRLREINPVDRPAIDERVVSEARQAGLSGIVTPQLAIEITGRNDDRRLRNAHRRRHDDRGRTIGKRVEGAIDRLRTSVEIEVATGSVHERISRQRDRLALRAPRDLGGSVPVGRCADHGVR